MKFTKTTLKRALRTFLQAAIGFLATTGVSVLVTNDYSLTKNLIYGLIGSAIAAGVAAVMNLEDVKQTIEEGIELYEIETEEQEDVSNQ